MHKKFQPHPIKHHYFTSKMAWKVQIGYTWTNPRQNRNPHVHNFWKNHHKKLEIMRNIMQKIPHYLDKYWRSYDFWKIEDENEIKIWNENELIELKWKNGKSVILAPLKWNAAFHLSVWRNAIGGMAQKPRNSCKHTDIWIKWGFLENFLGFIMFITSSYVQEQNSTEIHEPHINSFILQCTLTI